LNSFLAARKSKYKTRLQRTVLRSLNFDLVQFHMNFLIKGYFIAQLTKEVKEVKCVLKITNEKKIRSWLFGKDFSSLSQKKPSKIAKIIQ